MIPASSTATSPPDRRSNAARSLGNVAWTANQPRNSSRTWPCYGVASGTTAVRSVPGSIA